MEQPAVNGPVAPASGAESDASITSASARPAATSLVTQPCPTCGAVPAANTGITPGPSYIYAIGNVEHRIPLLSVEKAFMQAIGKADAAGLTDRQALHKLLSQRQNRYLARQLCWVMTIESLDTYILVPRDPADLDLLIESLRSTPSPMDLDCVIGVRGPIAPAEMCNGVMVPIVGVDQMYSFHRDALIKAIPRPDKIPAREFSRVAEELFDRIMQIADNAGATDEHRASNYLALQYPAIYANAADAFARNASLSAIDVRLSPLSGTRKIVEFILSYTNRNTDVTEKFFARVDVTEEFPFLVTKLSPYYDRYV
jgi:PatG C-terminal